MIRRIEKVPRTQVIITLRIVRIDARHVDFSLEGGLGEVGRVDVQRSAVLLELATHRRNHHVLYGKTHVRVNCIELPCHDSSPAF